MSNTTSYISNIDHDVKDIRIAAIGADGIGKTTLIMNFLKGYIAPNEAPNLDLNQIVKDSNGTFQVDLELNGIKYNIEIQERDYSDASDDYLDEFDGVIYMYATNNPSSFLKMQDFYDWQKQEGKELKPRVVIGTKLDLISDQEYDNSFLLDKSALVTKTGGLNFGQARSWATEKVNCDYAEISCHDPANVDEVFCLLIGIIEKKNEKNIIKDQSTKERAQRTLVNCYRKLGEMTTLAKLMLSLLSLFGIILLGASFYSGTKIQRPKDNNWLYVIMLFLSIFSFISGIVGFYGVKHESKEYLKSILVILIPVTIVDIAYVIVFFIKLSDLEIISNNILSPRSTKIIAIINVIDFVIKVITIIITIQVYKNFRGEIESDSLKKNYVHTQYKALESAPLEDIDNIAKSHRINPSGELREFSSQNS